MIQRVLGKLSQNFADILMVEITALLNLLGDFLKTPLFDLVQVDDVQQHCLLAVFARFHNRLPDVPVAVLIYWTADLIIFVRFPYHSVEWAKT